MSLRSLFIIVYHDLCRNQLKSRSPLDTIYRSQNPAKSDDSNETKTSVTKNASLITPSLKAMLARTIPMAPREFMATARLKLDSQSLMTARAAMRVPAIETDVANTKNKKNNRGSKLWIRSILNPTSAKYKGTASASAIPFMRALAF